MKRILAALLLGAGLIAQAQTVFPPFMPNPLATLNLAVTGSAQNLTIPAPVSTPSGMAQYVVTNVGTQTTFARCDGVTATVSNAMPFLPNSQVVISLPTSATVCSLIAGTTGSTVYFTIGLGQ